MGYIHGDVDIGLPDTSVCSCLGSVNGTVRLSTVVALKDTQSWFGVHQVCMKGGSAPQLGFSSLWRREGEGCWTGEENFFFFSGVSCGREGMKTVERRFWE